MMSDYLHLAMIMPFILYRFLKPLHLKSNELETIRQRIDTQRKDYVPKTIIKCWVVVAKTMKIVFERGYTEEKYDDLKECLEMEVAILKTVNSYSLIYFNNISIILTNGLIIYYRFLKNLSIYQIFILIFIYVSMLVLMQR